MWQYALMGINFSSVADPNCDLQSVLPQDNEEQQKLNESRAPIKVW
jgi:hypothetical protein